MKFFRLFNHYHIFLQFLKYFLKLPQESQYFNKHVFDYHANAVWVQIIELISNNLEFELNFLFYLRFIAPTKFTLQN